MTDEYSSFVKAFPVLHHVTHASNWPSIQGSGLWSVASLVERSRSRKRTGPSLTQRRTSVVRIPIDGTEVWVRDQLPIKESMLIRCLRGTTLPDWYRELNRRVFLFVNDRIGLQKLTHAYQSTPQCVLRLDSRSLLDEHGGSAFVCRYNSGSVPRSAKVPRGPEIFIPVRDVGLRMRPRDVRELTVLTGIPDLRDHLLAVDFM